MISSRRLRNSGLSDGERLDAWQSLRRGERRIAVGARSALFAPLERVGVVIVDEEHESSYKQSETPRYHAREAAIVRARIEGVGLTSDAGSPEAFTAVYQRDADVWGGVIKRIGLQLDI